MENQGEMETQSMIENQRAMETQGMIENQGKLENQSMSRKEKRKAVKKLKRKRHRAENALRRRDEEEALLNDPGEQERLRLTEQEEADRNDREIRMWEERDRIWLEEAAERKRREEAEEEERRKILEELKKKEADKENELNDDDDDDDWEYAEGPAEIIWQGNEIIVKKKRVRISKKDVDQHGTQEDTDRPTSNPLPPQSEVFSDCNASVISSQQAFAEVSEQIPNFGTEQDKTHCPFHFKTGVCRFGQNCSRLHYYPDKSCTLLMRNMYNGPGLAWEQDEGLEYTDDEVDRCYDEFYEDVHPEFQKHGEIVNFKVCRNGSSHLRGNVYVHYKSLDSAVLAYHLINGRYFAGKQITCEFVRVTKWRAAICGEYMKSGLKTCSHGMACNFIHCFRNPGGDYGWADWDKPPPRYWVEMMVTLFGSKDDEEAKQESLGLGSTSNTVTVDANRYHSRRSRSRESSYSHSGAMRRKYDENYAHKNTHLWRHTSDGGRRIKIHEARYEDEAHFGGDWRSRSRSRIHYTDSGGDLSVRDGNRDRERCNDHRRKSSRHQEKVLESPDNHGDSRNKSRNSQGDWPDRKGDIAQKHGFTRKSSKHQEETLGVMDEHGGSKYSTHEPDSEGGWSERDGDHNWHHDHMMKSLKNESQASEFSDNHRSSRYRTDATDSDGDSSHRNRQGHRYHNQRRKSSKHLDEVSEAADDDKDERKRTHDNDPAGDWLDGVGGRHHSKRRKHSRHWSDDHKETEKNVKDEVQEFDTEKPDRPRVQKHSHASRKDGSSKEIMSRADFLSEDQRPNGNHDEASGLGEHVWRGKSYNLDSGYNSDRNSDKKGDREPELHRKSRREKSTSYDPDSGYYSGNTIDKGHSLESEKDHPDKRQKYRDHEDYKKSISRSSNQSTSLSNADSFKEYQDSKEKDKKHDGRHRSSSHRQHTEKYRS